MKYSKWIPVLLMMVLVLGNTPIFGSSFVMMSDETLYEQSPLIVTGRVSEIDRMTGSSPPSVEYLIDVDKVLKGIAAKGSGLVVRVLGGNAADGRALKIFGAPEFARGERVLLFLAPGSDGRSYRLQQFFLGAFHQVTAGGQKLAVRDLSEVEEVQRGLSIDKKGRLPRDFDLFSDWLAARSRGQRLAPSYFVKPGLPAAEKYTLITSGINPMRWFQFDTGGQVDWVAHQSGLTGMVGGGFAEFQTALKTWNGERATPIDLAYQGTTTASAGFTAFDGVNAILFDDPNNEIAGTFSCITGGVLAIGGPWFNAAQTNTYNGKTFVVIAGGDIVTQNGAGCFYAGNGGANGEEVFMHELGHTLGLSHSCGDAGSPSCAGAAAADFDDAIMRASAHGDGRGAQMGDDDAEGINFLYGTTPMGPSFFVGGFSSGGLTQWSSSQTDSGDLSVTSSAALNGSTGLDALIDDTNDIFVTDTSPGGATSYRARFHIDPSQLTGAVGTTSSLQVLRANQSANLPVLAVLLTRTPTAAAAFRVSVMLVNDTARAKGGTFTMRGRPTAVEFQWTAATAPGANDGTFTLWRNGSQVFQVNNLDNDTRSVQSVRLGAQAISGWTGTLRLDTFSSSQQ